MMRIFAAATTGAVLLAATVTLSVAGGHSPIEQRQAAMKTVGKSAKSIGEMLKGNTDFNAEQAVAAMVAAREAVENYGELFPEGSETGFDTVAKDTIWSDRAGFDAAVSKFKADLDTAIAANPQDAATVGAQFGAVGKNCSACHETYRVNKT